MCEHYGNCESCFNDKSCELEHMGTGGPICDRFSCIADCKGREICITYEEELDMYNKL